MNKNYLHNVTVKILAAIAVAVAIVENCGPALAQYYYGPNFFSPGAYYPVRSGSLNSQLQQLGFSKLAKALEETPELVNQLKGGSFTILAPTDEAFDGLPATVFQELLKDKQKLITVLANHLVAGKITETDIKAGQVKTLGGNMILLQVNLAKNQIELNGAKPVDDTFNIKNESNNTITFVVIDKVLMPPQN